MRDAIDSILLPTDGSENALVGAKRGLDVAVAADAEVHVHVLSVVDGSEFDGIGTLEDGTDEAGIREAAASEAETAVEAVAQRARERDAGLSVTTATEEGVPYRVIADYVAEAEIDTVAMGTKGQSGVRRVLLGSVTENVLRTVDVPVLAVPPTETETETPLTADTVDDVLVPTDGSEGAMAAVDWGIQTASTFDATVHALYSADTSHVPGNVAPDEILAGLEETGREALDAVRDRAREAGVSVQGTVANGPPARVIRDYADDEIDLIAIGTHGRSGLERHLLGSITESVVRSVDVPVWCVPLAARDDA
ncbi:universal stress protein [Halobiforma lacisalsi AJ5]|uniref:Universal stress protein n=1 Tax=Natronobacterium lacisalsi AJ5 TaxID=358396 RepID=M0LIB9_NATLA|nr:universal stress protein [Halobiforma lacisalsi]APW98490.1 universal stress protein [Halobiforma lacisalsi AJ5]EMA33271.1 UspA domain-containing protein [Halobiforma lacisalsi AJ5]